MKTINIFLASSSELIANRKAFREFLSVENDILHKKGIYLKIIQWEYFLDSVAHTRLQDEYNKEVKNSEIAICLFHTKVGKFTKEEFDVALAQYKTSGSPLVYTYFKTIKDESKIAKKSLKSLKKFKKYLSEIGHYYTTYENMDELRYKFKVQLDILADKGLIGLDNVRNEEISKYNNKSTVKGNNNIVVQGTNNSNTSINTGDKIEQHAKKIYNIKKIDKADFS